MSVAFSPDGARVLSGSLDNTLKLWDVATGALIRTFEGHAGVVSSVAFSADGRRIVSGSYDTTTRIWDAATGAQLAILIIGSRDGQWLTMTPAGFFAASPKGHELLAVVRGLEVFSIDQFYQVLYRPDLVREKLAGDPDGKHGVFTFAVLDALARGDRDGDGFISVNELTGYVPDLVEDITEKTWRRRQVPRVSFSGDNFKLARQVPHMAPKSPDGRIVIPTKTTHFTRELVEIFKDAGGKGSVVQQLPPFSAVTLVKTEQGWVLIARDGKALGYVAEGKLQPLH